VIHVTNRPDVHVRLRTLEFFLRHGYNLEKICSGNVARAHTRDSNQLAFFITASATLFGTSMYLENSIV
jgi:hypothetical protein